MRVGAEHALLGLDLAGDGGAGLSQVGLIDSKLRQLADVVAMRRCCQESCPGRGEPAGDGLADNAQPEQRRRVEVGEGGDVRPQPATREDLPGRGVAPSRRGDSARGVKAGDAREGAGVDGSSRVCRNLRSAGAAPIAGTGSSRVCGNALYSGVA